MGMAATPSAGASGGDTARILLGGRSRQVRKPAVPVVAILLFALCLSPGPRLGQAPASEYQVKAAFLYNFARFVEWPEGTFPNSTSPFTVCIFGKDPFGRALDDALAGKRVGERSVAVSRIRRAPDLAGCQLVFVSADEAARMAQVSLALRGRHVLLVGENEEFAIAGGTIQFFLQGDRVRFAINPDAAGRAGLRFSSKLLALASIVRDAGAGGKN